MGQNLVLVWEGKRGATPTPAPYHSQGGRYFFFAFYFWCEVRSEAGRGEGCEAREHAAGKVIYQRRGW
jgi:hypothetical protein